MNKILVYLLWLVIKLCHSYLLLNLSSISTVFNLRCFTENFIKKQPRNLTLWYHFWVGIQFISGNQNTCILTVAVPFQLWNLIVLAHHVRVLDKLRPNVKVNQNKRYELYCYLCFSILFCKYSFDYLLVAKKCVNTGLVSYRMGIGVIWNSANQRTVVWREIT